MRNLKIFGLAIVGVLVMSAVMAGAAPAAELTAEKYPTTLTGKNTGGASDLFTTTAGNISCKSLSYHGTISGATTTVASSPTYGECTAFGFPATIDVNGCIWIFRITLSLTIHVDLSCVFGKEVTVTAIAAGTTKCTVHLKSQTDIEGTATFTAIGSGTTREISISSELKGIDYSHTKGTGLGACAEGSGTTGTANSKATATGEEESSPFNHIGIFPSL